MKKTTVLLIYLLFNFTTYIVCGQPTNICSEVTVEASICDGQSYILPDGVRTSLIGTYVTVLIAVQGCDSVITTNLTIENPEKTQVEATICSTENYTLPDGSIVNEQKAYFSTIINEDGCEQTVETKLTVNISDWVNTWIFICEGETYALPDGRLVGEEGTYETKLTSIYGCDSIINIILGVNTPTTKENVRICKGGTYTLPDSVEVSAAGVYETIIIQPSGCMELTETTIIVDEVFQITQDKSICEDNIFLLPDGMEVSTPGMYETLLNSAQNCDSIVITNLTVNTTSFIEESVSLCNNANYTLPNDSIVSTAGVYTSILVDEQGCERITETTIILDNVLGVTQEESICDGNTFLLPDGMEVSTTGVYETILSSAQNCDSIVITNLTVSTTSFYEESIRICENGSYTLPNDSLVSTAGLYTSVLVDEQGCERTTETTIIIDDAFEISQDIFICEGSTFLLPDGMEVSTPGIYETLLNSAQNCDSLILTVLEVFKFEIDMEPEIEGIPGGVTLQNTHTSPNAVSYTWSPANGLSCIDCPNPVATSNETSIYQLTIQDIVGGCTVSAEITVLLASENPVVATAFSPNQDGVNDNLTPINLIEDFSFEFVIYNRYGQKLFQTNTTQTGWDGTFNNQKQPVGVYVWILNYVQSNGTNALLSGNVTLIR